MAAPDAPRLPHPALRPFVTPYVGYDYVARAGSVHHGLPSTELTVVLALDQPLDVGWMRDPSSRGRHGAMASGLHAAPALIHQGGREQGIQLGLTPLGCRALLGMPAGELAGTMVALEDLLPEAGRVYDAVAGAPGWAARFDVLDRLLLPLCDPDRASARTEVTRAWARLHATGGGVRVQQLADEVGWSRRHLAARFGEEIGLTPKQVARILRLQRSRSRLLAGASTLAEVAAECGYADQAHMAREWQDLAGYAPTRWLREELPFVQDGVVAEVAR